MDKKEGIGGYALIVITGIVRNKQNKRGKVEPTLPLLP